MIFIALALLLFCVISIVVFSHKDVGHGLRIAVGLLLGLVFVLPMFGSPDGGLAIHALIIMLGAFVLSIVLSIVHLAAVLSARRAEKAGEL